MKVYEFRLQFNWSMLLGGEAEKQFASIGSDNGLAPPRRQAIIWTSYGWFPDVNMRHSASMS